MVRIPVFEVDSLNRPGQVRNVIREFEEEAAKIPGDLATPLFLAWRAEERARNGDILSSFTTFAKFTKEYVDALIDSFVEMSEGNEIFDYKEIVGSDPVYKSSKNKDSTHGGIWRITHMALIDPNIEVGERDIGFPFEETIRHVPTYNIQHTNNAFFNGAYAKIVETPEKLSEEARRNKGIKLLFDVLKETELQKAFFEDLQIPLISSYKTNDVIGIANTREYYERAAEKYEKAYEKWLEDPQKYKKPDQPSWYPIPTREIWWNSLDKTIQNQLTEYWALSTETRYNFTKKLTEIINKGKILETPCVLYALEKCGVSKEIIDEIKNSEKIHGNSIKIKPLVEILSKHKIQLIIYSIKKEDKINTNVNKHPRKVGDDWTKIEIDRYENHVFQRKKYFSPLAGKEVSALLAIAYGFKYGLLRKLNAFEFYTNFRNCCLDPIIKFNLAKFWKEASTHINDYAGVRKLRPKRNVDIPDKVYYADFETTTDEDHHIPYMVHCIGPDMDTTFIGEDCPNQMLSEINEKRGVKKLEEKTVPETVRVYFHNLKYDYTFVRGELTEVDECTKGTTIYSASGYFYSGNPLKKSKIEFWDTLPILRCKISKAAEFYIGGDRAKSFQKEACPYAFYTRKTFEYYPDYWVPRAEFESKFASEKEVELFRSLLPKLDETIYNKEKDLINYMEYSAFYCRQDVIIMKEAFENVRKLFLGEEEIEGINGNPPFKLDILKYRTISSIGWNYFVQETFGDLFYNGNHKKNECPVYEYSQIIRTLLRAAVRGGRTMIQNNEKCCYESPDKEDSSFDIVDYDAVSLYPSAGARAWIPRGMPRIIKPPEGRVWTRQEFLEWFEDPDSREISKKYCDGVIYVTKLHANKSRLFPLICVKNNEGLNNYSNFKHEKVSTMISMIDLFNFIELQDGEFEWEGALVWNQGEYPPSNPDKEPCGRDYSCQEVFKKLHEFRKKNHNLKDEKGNVLPDHPIANLSKLVSNSIYGKTNQKMQNFETLVVDVTRKRRNKGIYEEYNYWQEFFNANAYRIIDFQPMLGNKDHIKVRVYKTDTSFALVPFAINILAMSKRIIGRVIALAEDAAESLGVPGPFYTDTDSVHLLRKTLPLLREKFYEKFGYELEGSDLGQFHIDFDKPENFNKDEKVRGAVKSIFGAKKVYCDMLVGTEGSVGYHMRMKGICSDLVKWEHFEKFYNDEPVTFDLALGRAPRFDYDKGQVYTKLSMKRTIMSRECRKRLELPDIASRPEDPTVESPEISDVTMIDQACITPTLEPQLQVLEPTPYQPPEWAEWMEGETPKLEWEAMEIQEEIETQKRQRDEIDIETEDEDLEHPDPKRLKCYESIEDPKDLNMIISIENGHPPTHWERRVFDEGWDPEADEDMISWWKALGKEQREWLLKLRGDK